MQSKKKWFRPSVEKVTRTHTDAIKRNHIRQIYLDMLNFLISSTCFSS